MRTRELVRIYALPAILGMELLVKEMPTRRLTSLQH